MTILALLAINSATPRVAEETPYQIVARRTHSTQQGLLATVPLERTLTLMGMNRTTPLPRMFEDIQQGKGAVSVRRGSATQNLEHRVIISMNGPESSQLTIVFDTTQNQLFQISYTPKAGDPWKREGWNGSSTQIISVATELVTSQYPPIGTLTLNDQGSRIEGSPKPYIIFNWIVDGRLVGSRQTATIRMDQQSGAVLHYTGKVGHLERRPLRPDEEATASSLLSQRLAGRFGNGFYSTTDHPLIFEGSHNRPGQLIPQWELLCDEFDNTGRRQAIIQIRMNPDTRELTHEVRGEAGGFGEARDQNVEAIPKVWKHGDVEGQIRATDRKATQGGVQRTLTSGNRLLVGTFYAAERLLEVKGVFFEVDPALSKALAIAQPPASLNYGQ